MLKCASLYTYEADNHEIALEEIRAQLERKITLLKNTVGIIMSHTEFINTGVLKHICENLPFDLAGVTTSSQAVNDEAGELMLTVFIITADDVQFKTGVTTSLTEEIYGPTLAAFGRAMAGMPGVPDLALVFPPRIVKNASDAYLNAMVKIIPDTPIFGTSATDDTASFSESETIYNGVNTRTAMPFILCYGNIHPRFMIGTLPENTAMPYKAEVTKSTGNVVYEINNMNAVTYFEDIGLAKDGAAVCNFKFVPFVIDQKKREDYDGIPIMRVLNNFTEDGAAVFRGGVDENSTFTMLKCSPDDVLSTTLQTVEELNKLNDVNGAVLFPCIIRRMVVMSVDPLLELRNAKEKINPEIPFMMGYAGGETCPTSLRDGNPVNRFHNYSLTMLII